MTETKKRGGARPGAGRPAIGEETKPVSVQISASDLRAIDEMGIPINHFIREAIKEKLLRDKAVEDPFGRKALSSG
jgi:hypothetical protein